MRKHRLYGFCLAIATVAGVAIQRPGTANAATITGLPISKSTTHHHRSTIPPPTVDNLVGLRTTPSIVDGPRASAHRYRHGPGSLLRPARPTSGNGRFHASIRQVAAAREAENLRRLANVVRFSDAVALAELAHAAQEEQLSQAYQAAGAAQRAQQQQAPAIATGAPAAGGVWAALRQCESGGNYAEDSGNGYYGAYQFSVGTWQSLGYGGLPSSAPPAVQDAAARALQARSGWGQWPVCSQKLGL